MSIHTQGKYVVGNSEFLNKLQAMVYSQVSGLPISWHFHDDVFSSIDWTIPIETPLKELYRKRALQIREKYDFVSLFYSGGVDSTNVLHTFIDNGIRLDEIVMWAPDSLKSKANNIDTSSENNYSEIYFAAIPHLKEKLSGVSVKVRVLDYIESSVKFLSDGKLVSKYAPLIFTPTNAVVPKIAIHEIDPVWNDLRSRGVSFCHIQGADKPLIKYVDGEVFFQFKDSGSFRYDLDVKTEDHEFFYWTKDLPELVIAQCQAVKNYVGSDIFQKMLMTRTDRMSQDNFTTINQAIYDRSVLEVRNKFHTKKLSYDSNFNPWNWIDEIGDYSAGALRELMLYPKAILDSSFFKTKFSAPFYDMADRPYETDKYSIINFQTKRYKL